MTTPTNPAPTVCGTVKSLKWRAHNDKYDGGRTHYGTGAFGHWYAISRARNGKWLAVHHVGGQPHHLPPAASLADAKSAAQADYEARILAAIQPASAQPVAVPEIATVSVETCDRIMREIAAPVSGDAASVSLNVPLELLTAWHDASMEFLQECDDWLRLKRHDHPAARGLRFEETERRRESARLLYLDLSWFSGGSELDRAPDRVARALGGETA